MKEKLNLQLKNNLSILYKLLIASIFTGIFCRLFEYLYTANFHIMPKGSIIASLFGMLTDIPFITMSVIFISLLTFPFYWISTRLWHLLQIIIIIVFIIIYNLLIGYFSNQFLPLDAVILSYTANELIIIAQTSNSSIFIPILVIIISIVIFYVSYFKIKLENNQKHKYVFGLLICIAIIFQLGINIKEFTFENVKNKNLHTNKISYFAKSILQNIKDEDSSDNIMLLPDNSKKKKDFIKQVKDFQEGTKLEYTSKKYPFLHKTDTISTLSKYFAKSKVKPNIVLIIVESLSRQISGKNATICSFTPFLDSLASQSLYWENTLSLSFRTYGVLPSILASAPHGLRGFSAMAEFMPRHFSLANILSKNKYTTSFFYGGDIDFDNIASFISRQKVNYVYSDKFYTKDNTVYWGKNDAEVFDYSLDFIKKINSPQLNIYLTLSSHGPFFYPNKEYYTNIANRIYNKKYQNKKKDRFEKSKFSYASFVYTDEAIRNLIEKYKKRKDFDNTIFVITGDHSIHFTNSISKYHVPLIIYSPLIKKAKKFNNIVSHWDITPSLMTLLQKKWNLNIPKETHWLGGQLKTSPYFKFNSSIVLMDIDRKCKHYLHKNYYLSDNNLYTLDSNLNMIKTKNEDVKNMMIKNLNSYRNIDKHTCLYNYLLPKDKYYKYTSKEIILDKYYLEEINSLKKNKQKTYLNLKEYNLEKKHTNYIVKASAELYFDTDIIEKLPQFVVATYNNANDSMISFRTTKIIHSDGKLLKKNKWQKIKISQSTSLNFNDVKNIKVKSFFWNTEKLAIKFKNVKVKFIACP